MPAYVVVDIDIIDPAGFAEYWKPVVPLVQKYGGRYLAVSDNVETLEGDWRPKWIVMIEFESMKRAKEWFNCAEYHAICEIRYRTAKTKIILIEGV